MPLFSPISVAGTQASRGYRNAAYNTSASAWTKLPFDTADYGASNLDTTNNRYNVPATGTYLVTANVRVGTGDQVGVRIKGGASGTTLVGGGILNPSAAFGAGIVELINATLNDQIIAEYWTTNANTFDVTGYPKGSSLSVVRIA